jgi:sugar phosphate isomerase/epimerase
MATRRHFLASMGAGLGILSSRSALATLLSPAEKLDRIGIQLYTVRTLMEKDFEGTLARLAAIGFSEVEFAGYFKHTPAQVRAVLAANKLTSPSTHIPYPKDDAAWKKTLDETNEMGHQWATFAWIDDAQRKTPDAWKRLADRFNQLGTMAQQAGLRVADHIHGYEFTPFNGTN